MSETSAKETSTMTAMRVLTLVTFVAVLLNAFAPVPQHDLHHRGLMVTAFLAIVSVALVIADFRRR